MVTDSHRRNHQQLPTPFRRLALVTTAATYVLIAVGGLVRATDSGLGCPDWPRCFGRLTPPPNLHAWIEHSHRLVASLVIVLVAALAPAAWRRGGERGFVRLAAAGAGLVYLQMLVGSTVTGHEAGLAYRLQVLVPDLQLGAARLQFAHRLLAALVGVVVVATWLLARRGQRAHPTVTRLAGYAAALVA